MKKRMTEQLRAELAAYLAQYYLPQEELYVKEAVVFSDEEDLPLPMLSSPDMSMPDGAPSVCKTDKGRRKPRLPFFSKEKQTLTSSESRDLSELMDELGASFHEKLFQLIDASGMSDVDVYKRANLDRKLFSKIRSNPAYHPRKATVLALAIALRLDVQEADDLLSRAEYAFSPGSKADLIVKFFIEHGIYDIDAVNYALDEYGLPILN